MDIKVNGEGRTMSSDSILIIDLLKACDVELPDMVSVQVNGAFIDRSSFKSTVVNNGDEIDFLYFMGGGAK